MNIKIDRQILAGAGTLKGTVMNQDINGLFVISTIPPAAADYLTVNLKSANINQEPITLINRLSMLYLSDIQAIEGGFNNTLQSNDQAETAGTTEALYVTKIPLGCLKNQANSSFLEVNLEVAAASTVGLYGYFDKEDADHMHIYTLNTMLTFSEKDVVTMYAVTALAYNADAATRDVSIAITSSRMTANTDFFGTVGYTLSQVSADLGPLNTVRLWESPDGIPDNIDYVVQGAGASTFSILCRREKYNYSRVGLGIRHTANKITQTVRNMDPLKQRGLASAGKLNGLATQISNVSH